MLHYFEGESGLRLEWLNSGNRVNISDFTKLQQYFDSLCKKRGCSCKIIPQYKHCRTEDQEYYMVFSIYRIPEDLKPKRIYIRNERSSWLFYTDFYVSKLSSSTDVLSLLTSAHGYLKTACFLRELFDEFNTPLPNVLHGSEITGLKEYNAGRTNRDLPQKAIASYEKGLRKYFKQERTKSKYLQKWRAFSRTDKYDPKASTLKMFRDFHNRDKQWVPIIILRESYDVLKTTIINEHELNPFIEIIKKLDSDVLFSVTKIQEENGGFSKRDKYKAIKQIKTGVFGKLVTYEAYCKVREEKFVSEGVDALIDLNPTFYETRQLTYKRIDEPFIATALNMVRFAYAKSVGLHKVQIPGTDLVYILDIPTDLMENFVSLATTNKVPYHIDFIGRFGCPSLERLCIAYNPMHYDMMRQITELLVTRTYQYDWIDTKPGSSHGSGMKIIRD